MRRLFWRGVAIVLILIAYVQASIFAAVVWWKFFNPAKTAFMAEGLARLQETNPDAELRYKWVPYDRMSIYLKRAVVAAEDARFLDHEGFDWEGMQKAMEKDLKRGRIVAGGSTISQQLSKNLFLSASRNPLRKIEEAVITVMIEQVWGKRRILEVYLNVIEWGNGIYGAEAASRHYYRTSAAHLGPGQASLLAAMIPNPRYYENHRSARRLLYRQGIIEARMWQASVPR